MKPCGKPEIDHVRPFVKYLKRRVNDAWYFPPNDGARYLVALSLYSKCLTVSEAVLALLDAGFADEAFGVTRTLIDVYFTLRYITNKDTDERARRFYKFASKSSQVWSEEIKRFWPHMAQPLAPRTEQIAKTYPSPHLWAGISAKGMAMEPDTVEVDSATGQPYEHAFDYRVAYRFTSHYVHPTIVALQNHLVQAGRDNFVVRSGNEDMSHLALFNVAVYTSTTMVSFYRCMGDEQPKRLARWSEAIIKHLARRHI